MSEEIKAGEYVRTKDKILKIDGFEEDMRNIDCVCFTTGEIYTKELLNEIIAKHSRNIIDLIEIKDIVEIQNISDKLCFKVEIFDEKTLMDLKLGLEENEIKLISILTQKQYKTNCYRLED